MPLEVFYHWSPTERRNKIIRYGLRPNQPSTDGLWMPPNVCLGPTANGAWTLSGGTARGFQIGSWDLWEVFTDYLKEPIETKYYESGALKEIRVFERIPKRHVWYVGSRENGAIRKS